MFPVSHCPKLRLFVLALDHADFVLDVLEREREELHHVAAQLLLGRVERVERVR